MRTLKFVVERHSGGYLAYPLGMRGVVMGQGDSYEQALLDARSAAQAHLEAFGAEAFDETEIEAAHVAEGNISSA